MSFWSRLRGSSRGSAGPVVLLTGVPRSGTTLACHLLNKVPGVVALHEPMDVSRFFALSGADAVRDEIGRFCRRTRESVLERGVAPSKQAGGKVPDNPVGAARGESGLRRRLVSKGEVAIDRPVPPDFTLVLKHPGLFTALLPEVAGAFPLFAVVRNPLPVLCSWNTVDMRFREGHAPGIERVVPSLAAELAAVPDPAQRQIRLLDWYFERYARMLPRERVIRYEDVVASGGRALAVAVPAASALDEPLASRNRSELYGAELMRAVGERLLAHDGAWRGFYPASSVEELLR